DRLLLKHGLKELKEFVANHPNLLIIRADKGNITVILTIIKYNDKMHKILSDINTYRTLKKDPTNKLTMEIRTLLTRWKIKDFIDQILYKKLYISDQDLMGSQKCIRRVTL
ncbi:hypothetical protein ALC56_01239, partial [Trachymyrmex septentrionalis]